MLLSIVIPTKNRAETLYHSVRAALATPSDDVEVLVQDCSTDDASQTALEPFASDRRLRYERSPGAPSMTDNWNFAFARVRGEYVCLLGDDDAVGGDIVDAARWARANGADAILDRIATYFWPNFQLREIAGTGRIPKCTGRVEWLDAEENLRTKCASYPLDMSQLPHVYNGLVRAELMHTVKSRAGSFFDAIAPDYYSSFALGCVAKKIARVDYPLFMLGGSAKANTGRYHERKDFLHVLEYSRVEWPRYVPAVYSMTTVMAESAIKGVRAMGRGELAETLDFPSLYATFLVYDPRSAGATFRAFGDLLHDRPSEAPAAIPRFAGRLAANVRRKAQHEIGQLGFVKPFRKYKASHDLRHYDVVTAPDVAEAVELRRGIVRQRGLEGVFATGAGA